MVTCVVSEPSSPKDIPWPPLMLVCTTQHQCWSNIGIFQPRTWRTHTQREWASADFLHCKTLTELTSVKQEPTHISSHTHTHTHTHSLSFTHTLSLSHPHTLSLSHTHTRSLSHTHTHTHSLSHTHTHTHSLSHTHTHTHTLSLSLTHTHTLSLSHTHTHTLSLSHTHTHTHTHSLSLSHTHIFLIHQPKPCWGNELTESPLKFCCMPPLWSLPPPKLLPLPSKLPVARTQLYSQPEPSAHLDRLYAYSYRGMQITQQLTLLGCLAICVCEHTPNSNYLPPAVSATVCCFCSVISWPEYQLSQETTTSQLSFEILNK